MRKWFYIDSFAPKRHLRVVKRNHKRKHVYLFNYYRGQPDIKGLVTSKGTNNHCCLWSSRVALLLLPVITIDSIWLIPLDKNKNYRYVSIVAFFSVDHAMRCLRIFVRYRESGTKNYLVHCTNYCSLDHPIKKKHNGNMFIYYSSLGISI